MDIEYQLQDIRFQWDENKAQSNVQKHGITFEEAAEVFFDPFHQTGDASTGDEQRDFVCKILPLQLVVRQSIIKIIGLELVVFK